METHNRRAVLKTAGSVAIIGSLAGCAGGEGQDPDGNETENGEDSTAEENGEMAMVRVAHLSPDAPNVDIYVDEEPVLEDVAFTDVSDYLELEPATYNVQVTEAGTEQAVYDESLEVEAADYTLAAIGELSEENQPLSVEVFEDDLSDPGENARIRGVHAAPDAPVVDITDEETGDAIFEDLAFGDAQSSEVPPGEYTLGVVPAEADGADPIATFDASLEAGTVYTAFAVGYLEPADAPADEAFSVEIVEDSNGAADEMNGDEGETESA